MKVALIHDNLNQMGGAEKVLLALHELYPRAPIYTATYNERDTGGVFADMDIRPSFIQRLPLGSTKYKWFLPFMPSAFEQFDLSKYDVVISSSSAFSKGVITKPETLHVCYCHTPTRYLWNDHFEYIDTIRGPKFGKKAIQLMTTYLRIWDKMASDRVNKFIANSHYIARRIKKYYHRDSEIIYPPVETEMFQNKPAEDFYLVVSRLRPYKKVDLVIQAFNELKLPLVIIGSGEEEKRLRSLAQSNITFLGNADEQTKVDYLSRCKAFINPQEEDFGIAPIEAMASGKPVIAYGRGGALETIIEGKTGLFFHQQTREALINTVRRFEADGVSFDPKVIREHAQTFDARVFAKRISTFVDEAYAEHQREYTSPSSLTL
jgi:glycosyltransferase involved in cell wall biosynthesis